MSTIDTIIAQMQAAKRPSEYWARSTVNFPELETSKRTIQRNGQSVFDHTMKVIDIIGAQNHITLLSGLFHDLGKCRAENNHDDDGPKFPGHDTESVAIALRILPEWGAADRLTTRVGKLVGTHMYDITQNMSERRIRQFVATIGIDDVENWFALRLADAMAYEKSEEYCQKFVEPFRARVMDFVERQPKSEEPLVGDGDEAGRIQLEGGNT